MTMIGFCGSPRASVAVLRSPQVQESIITQEEARVGDKMHTLKAIGMPRATLAQHLAKAYSGREGWLQKTLGLGST